MTDIEIEHLIDPTYIVNELIYIYKHQVTFTSIYELMYANLNDPFYQILYELGFVPVSHPLYTEYSIDNFYQISIYNNNKLIEEF